MELELKHLAPYLPYGLKAKMVDYKIDYVNAEYDRITGIYLLPHGGWHCKTNGGSSPSIEHIKPILRPLSDLTKEIEHNGEKFVPHHRTSIGMQFSQTHDRGMGILKNRIDTNTLTYADTMLLFEWHFDVFGLIDAGLAVDINEIATEVNG